MARLLNWPTGLGKISYQRLAGPRTVGASSSESIAGYVQTVAGVFGVWRYQLALHAMHGRLFRLYRGMATGLHGGANAVRVPFNDPDVMSFAEAGISGVPDGQTHPEIGWSNGEPFSNGQGWRSTRPVVKVTASAAKGASVIALQDAYWGHQLNVGGWLGFFPFHLGKYEVTEVLGDGRYRIAMPLRKALVANVSRATLDCIVMAMRPESEGAATVQRGLAASEGNTLTLVEVTDDIVRRYFVD